MITSPIYLHLLRVFIGSTVSALVGTMMRTKPCFFDAAIRRAAVPVAMQSANCGEKALDILRSVRRPDYVLLDINMPQVDGFQVLETIRKEREIASTPVIMLTTSNLERDVNRARELGASGYVVKPAGLDLMAEFVKSLYDDWKRAKQPEYWPN